jgi:hypothetical protein
MWSTLRKKNMEIRNTNIDQKRAFHSTTMNYNLLSGQKTSLKTSLKMGERMSPKTRTGQKTDWKTNQRMSHNTSKQRHQKRYSLLVVNVIHKVTEEVQTAALCEVETAHEIGENYSGCC